ncbi:hypothetical protein ACLSYY_04125 [[Pasteurella] aerogenes]|nr:hypothetical protein [[Pasteurella] aerogenes]VEG69142.1 Uncharacterised protein [[Pasteurella] aerogenes]
MFYITKANYHTLLNSLELNIPFNRNEEKEYFWGSKMTSFDLDLSYFTFEEAKALLISDLLFSDTKSALNSMLIKKVYKDQRKWVFQLGTPSYHISGDCERLQSDFINVRVPKSMQLRGNHEIEQYRAYFIDNFAKYGRSENKIDPIVFCRKLIELFKLTESAKEMEQFYLRREYYSNSGVEEFNLTLNFEKEANEINSLIEVFNELVKDVEPSISRFAYSYTKKDVDSEEYAQLKTIFEQRKALWARILNFHFRKLAKEGFDLNEKIFELVGFQTCKKCCH